MSPDRAEELLDQALEFQADERAAFLSGACGKDVDLRRRVEQLLMAHEAKRDSLPETDDTEDPLPVTQDSLVTARPGAVVDRYKLLEKLGEGGFGEVWAAEQREPVKRRVALKVIKLGMDTRQVVARFEAERQALALMDHPNIARVLDAGSTEAGRPYFVMELVRGILFTRYCDQEKLSTQRRLELFIKVCHAIQHAHQKGIIHRDIKPSNILLTLHDGIPVPKVIDFGIAKATQQELTEKTIYTQSQQFIGTPAYMSPEQAELSGLGIDTRSDIYSLGVLLYELLTGRTPFDAKELMASGLDEMRKIIRETEPQRPSTKIASLSAEDGSTTAKHRGSDASRLISLLRGDLDWIVIKCLEKDRTRRYETANELARDLTRHLTNEPVSARPPSSAYRLQKLWRRNRLASSAAAAVAAALILGICVSVWQAARATRASKLALSAQAAAVDSQKAAERQRGLAERESARADAERIIAQRQLYAANMNLVQQAWDRNNVGRVRELLEEVAPYPERGFEWYYWQRQTRLELRTLTGHLDRVDAVAFSPDGRKIVSAGGDRVIRIWDTITGQELQSLRGHIGLIFSVAFSPDGQRLVSGSWDHTAKVWNVASGQMVLSIEGHRSAVTSVAFSANGLIATGSSEGTAVVWDAADATKELEIKGQNLNWHVDLSRDGQRLATSSRDGKTMIWEVPSGRELSSFETPTSRPIAVKFSPDGDRLVTTHADATIKMWNVARGKELFSARGHAVRIFAVAFAPNGQRIVTGSDDHTARIWDAETGRELLTLRGHSSWVRAVDFSMDGRIVTASGDKTLKVWDANGASDGLSIVGHTAPIRSVAFSPKGQRIVIGSEDQTATVWATQSGRRELLLPGHKDWISSVVFSTDGQRIATGSEDRTAKVWSAATGSELLTLEGHKAAVLSVAFSPDDQRIVTGSWDHSAIVWDVSSGAPSMSLNGHTGPIWSVVFSPDGQQIVTGSEDRTVRIWDASNGDRLFTLEHHTAPVRSVAYSEDGQRIVTGSVDGTATIWDAFTRTVGQVMRGHNGPIVSATFSANGRRVVTGSRDQTVRVWDTFNGRELLTLSDPTTDVLSATFSRDGRWILGGLADQTARLWEAMSPERLAAFQQEEHTAIEHLAVRQRKAAAAAQRERERRARDPGGVKKWLILAPIRLSADPYDFDTLLAEVMEQMQIPTDAVEFRPKEGDRVELGDRQLIWQAALLDDYVIEFDTLLGEGSHWPSCVGYAVSYIHSETEQRGLQMRIGCDTFAKVYLNGSEVYRSEQSPWTRDAAMVPDVRLDSGRNVLLLKVANSIGNWRASIRFTDVTGNPVKGIRVTLDPETTDSL